MNIRITLPGWDWVRRLCEWWQPGLEARAEKFGKASANRRFFHGIIDITTEAEFDTKTDTASTFNERND